jgi:hypothetical protein
MTEAEWNKEQVEARPRLEKLFKEKLTDLAGYFRHEEFYYKNIFDFTLREGKVYESQPFTSEERKFVIKRINSLNGSFAPNQCFSNSGKLAMADATEKIKYVEGFIFKEETGIPILHAWNEINGKVIDITIINKYGEYTIGAFENDIAYSGNIFPISYIRRLFASKTKSRSVLSDISDPNNFWPILKNQFTEEYINSL